MYHYKFFLLLICLFLSWQANTKVSIPAYSAPIIDTTNTLNNEQIAQLDLKLRNYEAVQGDGSQIAILLVPSIADETIEQVAENVFKQWEIGAKGKDNGILLLIAKNDRQVRIEVGYGHEGDLTDLTTKRIIETYLAPAFKQNNYYQGIDNAINVIVSILTKTVEPYPLPIQEKNTSYDWHIFNFLGESFGTMLLSYCIISYVISFIICSFLPFKWLKKSDSRVYFASGLLNGISASGFTFVYGSPLTIVLPIFFIVFVVSILLSVLPFNGRRDSRGPRSGGGGNFGSGGGFRGGGGGRSGGGGASGRW